MIYYNKKLKNTSRTLRKNMTVTERILWSRIRRKQLKGYQFYRQKTIGNYIVDFYCPSAKIIIELDGGQHYTSAGIRKDTLRDAYLSKLGFRVLRIQSREVLKNLDGALRFIYETLPEKIPPAPFLKWGEMQK